MRRPVLVSDLDEPDVQIRAANRPGWRANADLSDADPHRHRYLCDTDRDGDGVTTLRQLTHCSERRSGRRRPRRRSGMSATKPTRTRQRPRWQGCHRRRVPERLRHARPIDAPPPPPPPPTNADGDNRFDSSDACPTEYAISKRWPNRADRRSVTQSEEAIGDRDGFDGGCGDGEDHRRAEEGPEVGAGDEQGAWRTVGKRRTLDREAAEAGLGRGQSLEFSSSGKTEAREDSCKRHRRRVTTCRLGVLALGDSITNGGDDFGGGSHCGPWALWVARGLIFRTRRMPSTAPGD